MSFIPQMRQHLLSMTVLGSVSGTLLLAGTASAQVVAPPAAPTSPAPAQQQSPSSLPAQPVTTDDATTAGTAPSGTSPAEPAVGADIVVTGSYLNVRQEDRASPVLSITAQDLNRTGVTSLADITRFIPQNVGSAGGIQDLAKGGGADSRDTRSANLRGLGAGATLVLLNGRRVVPADGFVNLNSLTPEIAIERLETVLDGASSTYGADAVAGVFNVITNTRFNGLKVSAQGTHIKDSPAFNVQAMFGLGDDRFHSVTSAEYRYQDSLQNGDRAITNFFNPSSGAGANPGSYILYARPRTATGGDVIINGNNYSRLYDTYRNAAGTVSVVDPNCGSAETQSRYVPAANGPGFGLGSCQFSFQAQNPIRPEAKSYLIHNDTTYEVAPGHTLFAEISIYHQDSKRYSVPSYAQNRIGARPPIVPATNPYNPFGVDVAFVGRAIGSAGFPDYKYRLIQDKVDQRQFVLGARGNIGGGWRYTANATYSRADVQSIDRDTNLTLFQAALNGYGGPNCNNRYSGPGAGAVAGQGNCLYYSPFAKDTAGLDPSLIFNLQSNAVYNTKVGYAIGEGVVNGTLATINGHALDVAVGAQYRKEKLSNIYSDLLTSGFAGFLGPNRNTAFEREVKSVFAEANYEVIDGLNVNAAARYEDYGNFDTIAPKIAANWRIVPALSLRASASKAFQAPSIQNSAAVLISTNVVNIIDPNDRTTTFRSVQTFGNPNLQPQKADVFNIGGTLLPTAGLRLSVDYWHYKYKNQIQLQNGQAVINANPNGPNVLRDASGAAQTVIVQSYNAASGTGTSGIDVAGSYTFDIGAAQISLRDNLSYLATYDVDTGTVVYDGVGHRNNYQTSPLTSAAAPRWRNLASVDLSVDRVFASGTWRYVSGVVDDYQAVVGAPVSDRIGAWSVFDVQAGVQFGPERRFELTAGMINAFNKTPPAAKYTGYLSTLGDPFGRQTYLRLGAKF
ncbi:iron complex outermembrane recepter protein [Sphingomonas gellani]|uniref:Iron complex outermembrane recepter protein n=1 Tax=Sphingomonas gellani TaxID=1166340 RepID=A0A1H8JZ64_9SPHN|nr:TonB-dependent receptor [Sphingomonas gellani]SEN85990.1 iron complex outermembrane recepter protein [Sphingomonas gellani]